MAGGKRAYSLVSSYKGSNPIMISPSWPHQNRHLPRLHLQMPSHWGLKLAQRLKCLPPMQETWVRSLGQEDPLEKEMAIHSSILAWRIPWMEKPSRLQSTRLQRVRHDWATSPHLTFTLDSILKSRDIILLYSHIYGFFSCHVRVGP